MSNKRKMKGIILAGGTATRLFPLTATTSKQLLPVYDRQMIFYPLNTLIKAGITEILVIVSPDHSGQFLNLLGSLFKKYGVQITFEVQKVPAGLPEAFVVGENFIGDDNVTMILGDNIFEDDFSQEIKGFKGGGQVFAKKVSDPERFGVVSFDEQGKVDQIVEKPKEWISDYAVTGLYIYDHRVIQAAKNLKPSVRGEYEIVDLHRFFLEINELKVSAFEGEWLDAGTFDALIESGRIVKEKNFAKSFHPLVDKAIAEFNEELKIRSKRMLIKEDPATIIEWQANRLKENFLEKGTVLNRSVREINASVKTVENFVNSWDSPVIFWFVSGMILVLWYMFLNR